MASTLNRKSASLRPSFYRILNSLGCVALALGVATPGVAQQAHAATATVATATASNAPRITQAIDNSVLTRLKGNVHPLARAQYDQGPASPSLPMKRILMVLKRGDVQEAALHTFMNQQQDKRSPSFHQWLTPSQLGESYGPNSADIQAVTAWLESQGFQIGSVAKSGMFIEFSGTAAQVQTAFHTEIHSYLVNGVVRHANSTDPEIPSALAPVIAGMDSLNSFPKTPASHLMGTFQRDKSTGKVTPVAGTQPKFTFPTTSGDLYLVAPYDLATIYNVQPLWTAGLDGTGQTVAIVGETDINVTDAHNFRALFGLPVNDPVVIVNGIDPGFQADEGEANIDVQWSGAVAKGATIDFVTSASTEASYGIDLSALYIVENNLAPVMSESYGECELALGTGGNDFYNSLWEQASAQGISVFVSSGDEGSASCDAHSKNGAQYGYNVNGIGSTPYNVSAGGTDFDQLANSPLLYWNATNTAGTEASAKGYIPETTWNDSCTNAGFYYYGSGSTDPLTNCNNSGVINPDTFAGLDVGGGSGGPSTCIVSDGETTASCQGGYAKPAWQVGTPADNVRDTPDISLFASNGFSQSFYPYCEQDANDPAGTACSLSSEDTFQGAGGTSFVSPILAGMFAILNQKTGSRVGNPNYNLYNLASKQTASACDSTTGPASTCMFNDVTKGTISQACPAGDLDCYAKTGDNYGVLVDDNGAGYGTIDSSGYPSDLAFNTAVGYDYATGLGTLNLYNLIEGWSTADFLASATTLALSSTSFAHGTPVTATITVTATTGTPTGDVSLNGGTPNGSVGFATLASGNAKVSINDLPGGSYNVIAHYGGNNDGTNLFSGSDSNPVAVTIAPEASTTTVSTILLNVVNSQYTTGTTATYGAYYVIPRVDIAGASGNGVATGTVTLSANGTALSGNPFKLNSTGDTEDQAFPATAGTYTFSGSYSGDPSFNASVGTSNLTITPQTPTASLTASPTSVTAGTNVTLSSVFDTVTYVGSAPTGTVTFYAGTAALGTVNVTDTTDAQGFPEAIANFTTPAIPSGTNSITAKYSGDTNYAAVTSPAVSVTVTGSTTPAIAVTGSTIAAITAGASGTSTVTVTPSGGFTGAVSLTCTIAGPTGSTSLPTCSYNPASITIAGTAAGTSALTVATTSTTTAGSYTATVNAADTATGKVTGTASLPFTVNAAASGTFALTSTAATVSSPGQSGTSTISVTPSNGYIGTVNLSCALTTAPSNAAAAYNPSCTLAPGSVAITTSSAGTATATFATTAPTSGALAYPETNRTKRWYTAAGGAALACMLFFGIPARRRSWRSMLGLLIFLVAMGGIGCGGGGSHNNGTSGTTAGTYTFTVTGTDSVTSANMTTTVVTVTVN